MGVFMQRHFTFYGMVLLGVAGAGMMSCTGSDFASSSGAPLIGPPLVASVEIVNCPALVDVRDNKILNAVAKDANGSVVNAPPAYSSSRSDIASLSQDRLEATYPGNVSIIATAGGVASSPCNVTVLPPQNSKTVVQLTDDDEDETWGMNNNWSTLSRDRILWQRVLNSGDTEIYLGDTNGNASFLKTVPGPDVDFMALGSGASSADVLASWREDLSKTFVSNGSGTPTPLGAQQQEENSIADGHLLFRKGQPDNDILHFDSANGLIPVSTAGDLFNPVTSGGKAVWERQENGASTLVYFDGTNETPIVSGLPLFPRFDFRSGKIVYADGGDIFLYDADSANPQLMNITNNPGDINNFPKTDGHSIVFTRLDGGNYEMVLYEIASGISTVISNTGAFKDGNSLRIDLKQAIWMEGADLYFYDGNATTLVNPSPAADVNQPYLADGIVAWHGSTGPFTDHEIFVLK
jgi:hypothetical protein